MKINDNYRGKKQMYYIIIKYDRKKFNYKQLSLEYLKYNNKFTYSSNKVI